MRQNLAEVGKVLKPFPPKAYALASMATTGYFLNGTIKAGADLTNGIDMKDFGEALIILSPGAMAANSSVTVTLHDNDANTDLGMTAITNAAGTAQAFSAKTNAHANNVYVGRIKPGMHKRYLFVKAAIALNAHDDADPIFDIAVILSKAYNEPVSQLAAVEFMD